MLLSHALESALSPGTVRGKGEHFLQVLKHVIKESSADTPLLELSPMSVHSLPVGLEVAVKVSLLVGLVLGVGVGVKVVLVSLLLTESLKVFEHVIKVEVERLVVLVKVVVAASSSSPMALPW